jgi:hypothetical protein
MTFHPHVKRTKRSCRIVLPVQPDIEWVFVVETDLVIDPTAPNYDAVALKSLAEAVEDERKRLGIEKAEIWPA